VLATAFCGSAWAYLVAALLHASEPIAQPLAILVMLLVSTVMSLLSAAIPAAFVAGMLPMIADVILAYAPRLQGTTLTAAALAVGIVGYFLVIVQRLHAAAARDVSFQAEKDSLIAELEQARLNSDEARRRAESANLAKSRFLATMSHELRTPLNAILGFSEVMKGELFGPHGVPAYKEYSNDIHASGQHLLMLINEILDLSRVEAGGYELKEELVSLAGVVEECCQLLSMRAKSRNLTLAKTLERDLPRIWADERAVRQATLNLLTNAIKFTPHGGSVIIKVGWTAAGGQYVSIKDTGPGIPPEEIPIVLSTFGRGSLAHKNAEEGTGLGLPIVKGLVELHGGQFRLTSKLRQGTEAVVIFPRERVMDASRAAVLDAPPEAQDRRIRFLKPNRRDPAHAA
jgi:two-component system cell cycle sensor histidine kinase PleC